MKLNYRLPANLNSDRLKGDREGCTEEMSQASEYDSDDSFDLLPGPQRMSAPQEDRTKNSRRVSSSDDGETSSTSSSAHSSAKVKASSATDSSADEKTKVQLPRLRHGGGDADSTSTSEQEWPQPPTRKYVELPR